MNITIISGSPRAQSVTNRVAKHIYAQLLEQYPNFKIIEVDVRDWNLGLLQTVYQSVEHAPSHHKELAEIMFNTDAFILVSPEYNGSYSPALKNLLDHFPKQNRKPFGIVTASPGAMGGMRAAMQMQQMVAAFFGILAPNMLLIPAVDKKFNEDSSLIDPAFSKNIANFLQEFIWLAQKLQ